MKKVAIVTAASQGMGLACAKELKSRGYHLALMARSEKVLHEAKSLDAVALQGSVSNVEDLSKLIDLTINKYGQIDAVINNTGHPAKGPLLDLKPSDWHDGLDLILMNVAELAKLTVPIMIKNGGGSFVNISTFAAFEPNKAFPISSVIRAALAGYTKLFADEYASQNIRMNNVLPGYINSYEVTEEVKSMIPMGRSGTVEEIAKTVAFLISEDASYLTGQNITVDGGLTRAI